MEVLSFIGGQYLKAVIIKKEPSSCMATLDKYVCNICNFKTNLWVDFKQHVAKTKMKLIGIAYICEVCNFKTYSRLVLTKHVYRGCKMAKCNTTPVLVYFKGRGLELFHCMQPQPPIKTNMPLATSCTTLLEPYKCKTCNFQTPFWVEFTRHVEKMKNVMKPIGPVYICKSCNFETYCQLVVLKHVHGGCTAAPTDSTPVPVHVKGHVGPDKIIFYHFKPPIIQEKLFKCHQCWFETPIESCLGKHVVAEHTPKNVVRQHVRPVKRCECEQCGYKTTGRLHLRSHFRETHPAVKWFKCEHCAHETKWKRHLKRHMIQKHTASEDIKWFQCEQCSYKAKIKTNLKAHVFNRHGDGNLRGLKCEKCSYRTKQANLLDKHVLKKHAI